MDEEFSTPQKTCDNATNCGDKLRKIGEEIRHQANSWNKYKDIKTSALPNCSVLHGFLIIAQNLVVAAQSSLNLSALKTAGANLRSARMNVRSIKNDLRQELY